MEGTSTPLADYFWIAGVESIAYDDVPQGQPRDHQYEQTIAEDGEPAEEAGANGSTSRMSARHSRHSSGNRFSKMSFNDNRFSINTIEDLDTGNTASNRSSATIRPVNNGGSPNGLAVPENGGVSRNSGGTLMEGFDFDKALLKFAAEREDFLSDLEFSAGAKVQAVKPMVNPRTERIKADDGEPSGRRSPLRSLRGSIRRRISFRDMNSLRKQPSTAGPRGTNRTCKLKNN